MAALPKPLGRTVAGGAQGRGRGGGTRSQGVWEGSPAIADEHGKAMDRVGGEAIRNMEQQKNAQLVERLGRQIVELFTGLTLKQEEDSRRLKEENLAIRKQTVELEKEKWEQHNRTEQLMAALLKQMGGDQHPQGLAVSAEMTPVRGSRPAVVVPEMPGTQEKQARPGVLAPQGASAASPGSLGADEAEELVKKSQMLEEALRDVLATVTNLARYLQAKGHCEVVGMIDSGSQVAPVPE